MHILSQIKQTSTATSAVIVDLWLLCVRSLAQIGGDGVMRYMRKPQQDGSSDDQILTTCAPTSTRHWPKYRMINRLTCYALYSFPTCERAYANNCGRHTYANTYTHKRRPRATWIFGVPTPLTD